MTRGTRDYVDKGSHVPKNHNGSRRKNGSSRRKNGSSRNSSPCSSPCSSPGNTDIIEEWLILRHEPEPQKPKKESKEAKKAKKAKKAMEKVTDKELLVTFFKGDARAAALGRDMETEKVTLRKTIISHGDSPLSDKSLLDDTIIC